MKLFRHGPAGHERPGVLDSAGQRRDLSGLVGDIDADLLASDFEALRTIALQDLPPVARDERLGAPVARVGKFICIGLNYAGHVREISAVMPSEPVVFMKATSAICGPHDDILLPPDASKTDWEVELGVVIGEPLKRVSMADALRHVAGLCVINDVSERAFQLERGGQWDKGKSCDTFGPMGPYLVTLDEVQDVGDLDLWCDVNGTRMQTGNTGDLIFGVAELVSYVSRFMSLQPGDVISTGTPAGVGLGRAPPVWLQPGDVVSLGISGLGEQRQTVVGPVRVDG